MSDCISRESAIACLYSTMESYYIKRNIMDLPAADAVEVIRCKDCKHWNKSSVSGEWPDKVTCCCKITQHYKLKGWTSFTAPDDYCSFAEREVEK